MSFRSKWLAAGPEPERQTRRAARPGRPLVRRFVHKRPSPALVVAFIALLVAGAPFAAAGVKAVKRGLLGKNGGKADGLRAAAPPKGGKLLAHNKPAPSPASVIPPQPKSTVARARTTGSTSISSGSSNVSVPLTGNTWTQ